MIAATISAPKVVEGQKIKALFIPSVTGSEMDSVHSFTGQIVTVESVYADRMNSYADGVSRIGDRVYARFWRVDGDTSTWYISEWEIADEVPTPELDDKADPVVELTDDQKIIVSLRESLRITEETLARIKREAIDAMDFVNTFTNEEAVKRDWCEQYDEAVEHINDRLPNWLQWELRQREFTIRVYADVRVEDTVTVSATCLDDALEMAQEMFNVEESFNAYGYDLRDIECEEA